MPHSAIIGSRATHRRRKGAAVLAHSRSLLAGLHGTAFRSRSASGRRQSDLARILAAAKSWGYQLQNVDPDVVAASPYDMVVIDYSRDGTSDTAFTPADLEKMKRKPDGSRRIVLSYLSIGEAEKYRYYWKWYWGWFFGWFAPSWRDRQNTEWRGNYAVRYWEPGWQEIIFSRRRTAISTASSRRGSTASGSTRSTSSNSSTRSRTRRR